MGKKFWVWVRVQTLGFFRYEKVTAGDSRFLMAFQKRAEAINYTGQMAFIYNILEFDSSLCMRGVIFHKYIYDFYIFFYTLK